MNDFCVICMSENVTFRKEKKEIILNVRERSYDVDSWYLICSECGEAIVDNDSPDPIAVAFDRYEEETGINPRAR